MGKTCCVYDDQDMVSEKEQGGRCNELVRKNQSSMLHVLGTKKSDGTLVMRQEVNTTGFEDESFVSGGDLSCPRSWIGSSGRTAVRGNAPFRSYDLNTSISWPEGKVKGIRELSHS